MNAYLEHVQGIATAPVELLEYADYQCPYCKKAYFIIKEIRQELGNRLKLIFRNFPLTDLHSNALHAAFAAEAAGAQGRYWQMHDRLFENQHHLEDQDLLDYARQIGLDIPKFEADFSETVFRQKIERDFEAGVKAGVQGTPSFFINGAPYRGNWTTPEFVNYLKSI